MRFRGRPYLTAQSAQSREDSGAINRKVPAERNVRPRSVIKRMRAPSRHGAAHHFVQLKLIVSFDSRTLQPFYRVRLAFL